MEKFTMDKFKVYAQSDLLALVNQRPGEEKLGEKVQFVSSIADLEKSTAKFVLLGIPEDIGVRANHGIGGAKTAWNAALKAFLNFQSNEFLRGPEVLVLGHFEIEEPAHTDINGLRNKVREIDELVWPLLEKIVAARKIPIIIGGGHNNAFPIIRGTAIALNQKINVVNIDAHADLRDIKDGRHSGNGFSYALQDGYLAQYRVFGLHQNYVNQALPGYIASNANITAAYFEDLLCSEKSLAENWTAFISNLQEPCGLELDLDSIENILSSAVSSSGFALNDIRTLLLLNRKNFSYLHLCEGATQLEDKRESGTVGKTIAYLVSDFMKG
ncbi:MAG: formimidoylglutamase [Bacteroidota bacterium]